MKFYIAARYGEVERVRSFYQEIIKRGHTITRNWTNDDPLKPYDISSSKYAQQDINAVRDCDVFILISSKGGTGMYVEFGVALARCINNASYPPLVFVVGDYLDKSIFFFHPLVRRCVTLSEVFDILRFSNLDEE